MKRDPSKKQIIKTHLFWLVGIAISFGLLSAMISSRAEWKLESIEVFEFPVQMDAMENGRLPESDEIALYRDIYSIRVRLEMYTHPFRPDVVPDRVVVSIEEILYHRDHISQIDEPHFKSMQVEDLNPDTLEAISYRFSRNGDDVFKKLRDRYGVPDYEFTFDQYMSTDASPLGVIDYLNGFVIGVSIGCPVWGLLFVFGYWYFYRGLVQGRRLSKGLCIYCTYPLQDGLCTECGYHSESGKLTLGTIAKGS